MDMLTPYALSAFYFLLALAGAPLLQGVIYRIKAIMAGRNGKPLFQLYYDLGRLLRKGTVYPANAGWIFRAGPLINLTATLAALTMLPFGACQALLFFPGDFFLAAYLLALGRFFTLCAALDSGSAFEGMGASRDAAFSALAEPVFLLALLALGLHSEVFSLSRMLGHIPPATWQTHWPVLCLLGAALFLVLLVENCRIPVDDPTTHLELTMIHEVMVLDHGGPDLAFIEYAAALKLWFFATIVAGIVVPNFSPLPDALLTLAAIFPVTALVGFVEACLARLRMDKVPQFPAMAGALAALACLLIWK